MRPAIICLAAAALLVLAAACAGGSQLTGPTAPPATTPAAASTPGPTAPSPTAPVAEASASEPSPAVTPPPPSTPRPTPEPTTEPSGVTQVTAYYVRPTSDALWVEPERRTLDRPTVGVAKAAMEALFGTAPTDPGLARPVDGDVTVLGVNLSGGTLTVDGSASIRSAGGGSAAEEALAQALAHTAAQFDGVKRVQLWVDGAAITDLWGHRDWSEPVAPDPFRLAPIIIEQPEWGANPAPGRLTVTGTANTFEATLMVRLVAHSGTVIEEAVVTATCGSGCRGEWRHTFDTALTEPGMYTVEAEEVDPSGGEGRRPFKTQTEFSVG